MSGAEPFWSDESERRLVVRSVARFSDECDAPELTPECPFYEIGETGPVCAEQCRDLLERFPEDRLMPDETFLAPGIAAVRRPRPRRGPTPESKAFDARERRLSDEAQPLGQWWFTSLLLELKDRAPIRFPAAESGYSTDEVLGELARRGIAVDMVIPRALAGLRAGGVMLGAVMARMSELDIPEELQGISEAWAATVREFVGSDGDSGDSVHGLVTSRFYEATVNWYASLSAKEFFSDTVPSADELRRATNLPRTVELDEEAAWLLDRFTETYMHEWARTSLHREWRYMHSLRAGCVPNQIMRENPIASEDLAAAIADSACRLWEREDDRTEDLEVGSFTQVALTRLRNGQTADAVAIYRGLAELRPDDSEIQNNLGFCLIPDSPSEAYDALRRSIDLANGDRAAFTYLNLALAAHRNGDDKEAMAAISQALEARGRSDNAYLWSPEPPLEVGNVVVDDYIDTLTDHIRFCAGCRYATT